MHDLICALLVAGAEFIVLCIGFAGGYIYCNWKHEKSQEEDYVDTVNLYHQKGHRR